jgi:hypothetical protein
MENMYVATSNDKLWVWERAGSGAPQWKEIGLAQKIVGMTALNGKLYAATSMNELWVRDPVHQDRAWNRIGHADFLTAIAALNGKLYATGVRPQTVVVPRSSEEASWTTCLLWKTNHIYWQARGLIKTAKSAGRIKDKEHCLGLAGDAAE